MSVHLNTFEYVICKSTRSNRVPWASSISLTQTSITVTIALYIYLQTLLQCFDNFAEHIYTF